MGKKPETSNGSNTIDSAVRLRMPVFSARQLVTELESCQNRPSIFADVNMPFEDHSDLLFSGRLRNHFPFDTMHRWATIIQLDRPQETEETITTHFGNLYKTTTFTTKDDKGFPTASISYYNRPYELRGHFEPYATVELYGHDPDDVLQPLSVAVTRYLNSRTSECVDVYKITEGVTSLVSVSNAAQEYFEDNLDVYPEDIIESTRQRRIRMCVGDTGWAETFQSSVIEALQLPTA